MRAIQFWILLLGSLVFVGLQIKAVYVSRALAQEELVVDDSKATAETQPAYENAWKQLSLHIYQSSSTDPVLQKILKDEKIIISTTPVQTPHPSTGINAPAPVDSTPPPLAPAPTTPSKPQVGPMHP